jgi:hypothetical protein
MENNVSIPIGRDLNKILLEYEIYPEYISYFVPMTSVGAVYGNQPNRIQRIWNIIRHFVHLANQDHLLDEWIHLPAEMPSDYQVILNTMRSRFQAFEQYANYNNHQSITRDSLRQAIIAITMLEYSLNNDVTGIWVSAVNGQIPIDQKFETNELEFGDIAIVSNMESRSLVDAYKCNDVESVRKKLIKPKFANVAVLAFSTFPDLTVEANQWAVTNGLAVPNNCKSYLKIGRLKTQIDRSGIINLLTHH